MQFLFCRTSLYSYRFYRSDCVSKLDTYEWTGDVITQMWLVLLDKDYCIRFKARMLHEEQNRAVLSENK